MELHDILFKWLQTFELKSSHIEQVEEITDGVVMAEVLNQIEPDWFTDDWLATRIKTDTISNWRLKVSNLKKILEKIIDYYQECFNQNLSSFRKPDLMKIAEQNDAAETGRLLQLILGCAVNCTNKQEYIRRIMMMDETEQRAMMECIQELDGGGALSFSASFSLEPQMEQLIAQLAAANLAKDQLTQRCMELDHQLSVLQEEKAVALDEKKRLMEQMQNEAGNGTVRKQMDFLKEELFKMETQRDDYRLKLELQEKEMADLQLRVEELQKTASEARRLKDEVDILRETADKVETYEATIKSYKKKLEESSDLKREFKALEAKNANFIQQIMELEEELKKSGGWKAQMDHFKKQISDLHEKLSEEAKRADKLQYEVKNGQDKMAALAREKERLLVERDSLKEANEELKCLQLTASGNEQIIEGPQSVTDGLVSITELRQKMIRLQHENNMLRHAQKTPGDSSESLTVVQSLLDDANQQIEKMWKENREANQKIIKLEGELKELSEKGEEGAQSARSNMLDLHIKLQKDKQRMLTDIEERDSIIAENKQVITHLQDRINQKDLEFQELEDKYKKCLEKAKQVFKDLEPSVSGPESLLRGDDLKTLKQLKEHQKQFDKEKMLMATAFHNLAHVKHRESADQRLSSGSGQSFLSWQRKPTPRKMIPFSSK